MLILEISKSGIKDSKVWSTVGNGKNLTPKRASKVKDSLSEKSGPHNINKNQTTHPKVIFMWKWEPVHTY